MNKEQDLMKRSTQFAATTMLAAGFAFILAGCQGDGQDATTASTMPDHPTGDHTKGDHTKGDHPEGEHASDDHPNADHPE